MSTREAPFPDTDLAAGQILAFEEPFPDPKRAKLPHKTRYVKAY